MEQYILFDELEKKEARAMALFRLFEDTAIRYHPDGYYLAFSGGKDSVVIYALAKMAGVRFKAHYHMTTVDPPELVRFIRSSFPEVSTDYPEYSMWNLIVKKQIPPVRTARYCCQVLKERGGEGCFTVTGVRWQERAKRMERNFVEILGKNEKNKKMFYLNCDNEEVRRQVEVCQLKGKRVLNPIIDWTEDEVWNFIRKYHLPYCCLYDQGFCRIGCIGCPLASTKNRIREFQRYPGYRQAYIATFDRMVQARTASGKSKGNWKDGESVFNWWLYGGPKTERQVEGQMDLSEFIDMAA